MGWKQEMERRLGDLEDRVTQATRVGGERNRQRIMEIEGLRSGLSALEAKVGEGKCCGCATDPQPGDRVKLRDVPLGRWVDGLVLENGKGCPAQRCLDSTTLYHHTQVEFSGGRYAYFPPDTLVTLLPEDYQPEGRSVGCGELRYTGRERLLMDLLVSCWESFLDLYREEGGHPSDPSEFSAALHAAQEVVMSRLAARCEPGMHPLYRGNNKPKEATK